METPDKMPWLRFKDDAGNEFPKWEEKRFSDVLSIHATNSLSRSQLNYEKGDVRNIHYGDIHTRFKTGFDVTKEKVPFINPDLNTAKIPEESYCKPGDIVIADASEDYADIGKTIEIINTNNEKIVAGLHTYLARDKNPMAIGFKAYMMQSEFVRQQMMTIATGISVLGISKTNLNKVNLRIPCVEEQQKIAGFLTAIDNRIQNLEKQLEELRAYKKGVTQTLFAATEKDQFTPPHTLITNELYKIRFTDENGNGYPAWTERTLGELMTFKNGLNAEKHQYGKGIKFINVLDIINNNFITYDKIIGSVAASEKELLVNEVGYGDILFQRSSETREEVGQATVYLDQQKATFGGFVIRGKAIAAYNPVFMNYLLKTEKARKEITDKSGGSTRYNIGQDTLKEVKVYLPCLEEQKKIADFFMAVDGKIEQAASQIDSTRKYKQSLMQQLFN